jgi:hypothetical protein
MVLLFRDRETLIQCQEDMERAGVSGVTMLDVEMAKGLEYSNVALVDFFSSSGKSSGGGGGGAGKNQTKMDNAWRHMMGEEAGGSGGGLVGGSGGKAGGMRGGLGVDRRLEHELKLLYTGLTRCKSRLYFVETAGGDARKAAFDWMRRTGLGADLQNDDDFSAPQMATGAQVRRGCELMSKAVGSRDMEYSTCQQLIRQAIKLFEKAGSSSSGSNSGKRGGEKAEDGADTTFYDLKENANRHLSTRQIIADCPILGGGAEGAGEAHDALPGGGGEAKSGGAPDGAGSGRDGGGKGPGPNHPDPDSEAWNTKASTHVMDCFDHGMYGDALQLVAMTTLGVENGAIAKYLRDEIRGVAKRAAAVTTAYSGEVGVGGDGV